MKLINKKELWSFFKTILQVLIVVLPFVFLIRLLILSPVFASELVPEPNLVPEVVPNECDDDYDERDYLIVVNRENPYDFYGEYAEGIEDDLVWVVDSVDGDRIGVEASAYYAFTRLQQRLAQEGMIVGLYDGYRTWEQQKNVYDYFGSLEGWAETNTVLLPYFSEHHTGLLLNVVIWYDIDGNGQPEWCTETAERQAQVPFFQTLHENLADFGFIDRYPSGKEWATGVVCEPYEIRYVGSTQVAHEIMDNDLSLEEYTGVTLEYAPWTDEELVDIAEYALSNNWSLDEIEGLIEEYGNIPYTYPPDNW